MLYLEKLNGLSLQEWLEWSWEDVVQSHSFYNGEHVG